MNKSNHKIIFSCGTIFEINKECIDQSSTLVELFNNNDTNYKEEININGYDASAFFNILDYLKYNITSDHISIAKLLDKLDYGAMIDIICLAEYLNLQVLTQLVGDKFKEIIFTKKPEKVREIFRLDKFDDSDDF